MTSKVTAGTIVAASVALCCILFIAAAMGQLEDSKGFRIKYAEEGLGGQVKQPNLPAIRTLTRILAVFAITGVIAALVIKRYRRTMVLALLAILALVIILGMIKEDPALKGTSIGPRGSELAERKPPEDTRKLVDIEASLVKEIPAAVAFAGTFLLLGALAFIAYKTVSARKAAKKPLDAAARLASYAERTLDSLDRGTISYPDAVTECFAAMQRLASETLGVSRPLSATPREFSILLTRYQIPFAASSTLAELYEEVRYGEKVPDASNVARARASLKAIADACKAGSPH